MLAHSVVRAALDAVWPQNCPLCENVIRPGSGAVTEAALTLVHLNCLASLKRWQLLPASPRPRTAGVAVRALFVDDPRFFRALHAAKYAGRPSLLRMFARELGAAAADAGWIDSRFVVTPVPDDPWRRRERGFGPAEILARSVAERASATFRADLLRRRSAAASLSSITGAANRRDHHEALWGIARLAEIEREAPIALVDDQITTGSTVSALVRLLGARGNPLLVLCLASSSAAPGEV